MENIKSQNVGVIASAMSHVPTPSFLAGVVNADPRLRSTWGEVCPLTPAVQFQGTVLPGSTPIFGGAQVVGARLMGKGFDKYRSGSHAIGIGG